MLILLIAIVVILAGGVGSLWVPRFSPWSIRLGLGGAFVGCGMGFIGALHALLSGARESLHLSWRVPYGSFFVEVDPLSAFFLLLIFGLSGLAAVYGTEYLAGERLGAFWFFFNALVTSMALVVLARNGVLFLVAWEAMSLASFFLVVSEDEQESVRAAGWTYLVAMHLGTAFLLALFILLGQGAGTLDFDRFGSNGTFTAGMASLLFLLGVVGFGTKAGFMPFHVWLPQAHPAAPSPISALMSGVMIKMGIYGFLRLLTFLGPPPVWWGWLLIGIGATSGIFGVLFALAQRDIKRLLAYCSVENIGIITLGLGVGLLGVHDGLPPLIVLGFGGGLLHVLNHAVFKGLLFLGAGAVWHGAGTRDLERTGGLLKRMPGTAMTFLVGAVAISGLPPLNGFASEFLIYLASLKGAASFASFRSVPFVGVIAALGLIGGLATACFTKAFGMIFLGEPRSHQAAQAHEAGPFMRLPMIVLAGVCLLIGLAAPLGLPRALSRVLADMSGLPPQIVQENLLEAMKPLGGIVSTALGLMAVAILLAGLRRILLRGRSVRPVGTWDCGYAQPSVRMQYTASSFTQPLVHLFHPVLQTRRKVVRPQGLFPAESALETETPDIVQEKLYGGMLACLDAGLSKFRWLQHGRVQLYVLYIMATLLILLVWKLG